MNKIKKYIGAALIAAMMAGSVHSQETVITDPKKICEKKQEFFDSLFEIYRTGVTFEEFKDNLQEFHAGDNLDTQAAIFFYTYNEDMTFHAELEKNKCLLGIKKDNLTKYISKINKLLVTTKDGRITDEQTARESILKERLQDLKKNSNKDHTLVIIESPHNYPDEERRHDVRVEDLSIILEDSTIIKFGEHSINAFDVYINASGKVVQIVGKSVNPDD